jgi:hypothetical protein
VFAATFPEIVHDTVFATVRVSPKILELAKDTLLYLITSCNMRTVPACPNETFGEGNLLIFDTITAALFAVNTVVVMS